MDTGTAGGVVAMTLGFFILYVALSGLIVGALARWILPGPDPMSWFATIGYGIAGSFVGGLVARLVTLLGGAPGAGKTAFAMQLVTDALRLTPALRALVCNVEMPARVLLDR